MASFRPHDATYHCDNTVAVWGSAVTSQAQRERYYYRVYGDGSAAKEPVRSFITVDGAVVCAVAA
jgi:hypothetical protein